MKFRVTSVRRSSRSAPRLHPVPYSRSSGILCAEFQDDRAPAVLWLGPSPSEWPTTPRTPADSDVQSEHVRPAANVPSAFDPVRMSCWFGPETLSTGR